MSDQFGIFRPTEGQALYRLSQRVDNLERRLRSSSISGRPATREWEILFSQAGSALVVDGTSRYYPPVTARLDNVLLSLDVAGSTATVVDVLVNGGSQGTITLAAGAHAVMKLYGNVLAGDAIDWLTLSLTAIGTGAGKLTAQTRWSA